MTVLRLLLVFLLCLPAPAATAAEKHFVVAYDGSWPPMEFPDKDGNLTGYSIDYVDAVAREAGFAHTNVAIPWSSIFAALADGRCDIVASSVTITPDRLKAMDFSLPYMTIRQAALILAEDTFTSVSDLNGKILGGQESTTGFFAARRIPGAQTKSFPTLEEAVEALVLGELDAVICDDPVALYYANRHEAFAGAIKAAFLLEGDEEEFAFAARKGDGETVELLNRGILAARAAGVEERLRQKWLGYDR
jgi:polar amino acid transport system substrate-binding protein